MNRALFIIVFLPAAFAATAAAKPNPREGYLGDEACRSCHAAQVDSFHQTAHFLTSSAAQPNTSILGKFTPGDNILKTVKPKSLLPHGCERRRLLPKPPCGPPTSARAPNIRRGGWLRRKGQTYLFWDEDQLFQLPSLVLERSGLGKQPRLSRWLCRFRARHHSPLPGVSRDLFRGPAAALQSLQHHRLLPRHPMRKMSRPGKGTRARDKRSRLRDPRPS